MIERAKELLAESKLGGILSEIHYPITKDELVSIAEEHNAPDMVIDLLNRLPDGEFDSAMQVIRNMEGHGEAKKQPTEGTEFEEGD